MSAPPVDLDGSGRRDANAPFACYKVKDVKGQPAFPERDVVIDNLFELQKVTAKKARTVCVPAARAVLP